MKQLTLTLSLFSLCLAAILATACNNSPGRPGTTVGGTPTQVVLPPGTQPTTENVIAATNGTPTKSSAGPNTDGGGNVDNKNQVLDLVEDSGLEPFDILNSDFYQKGLLPKFKELNSRIRFMSSKPSSIFSAYTSDSNSYFSTFFTSEGRKVAADLCKTVGFTSEDLNRCVLSPVLGFGLGDMLRSQISLRKWYFEKNDIVSEGCVNKSMISLNTKVAACQDDYEVRISRKVWNAMDITGKTALITHELILSIYRGDKEGYEKDKQQNERSVRVINGLLYANASDRTIAEAIHLRGSKANPMWGQLNSQIAYSRTNEITDKLPQQIHDLACQAGMTRENLLKQLDENIYRQAGIQKVPFDFTKNYDENAKTVEILRDQFGIGPDIGLDTLEGGFYNPYAMTIFRVYVPQVDIAKLTLDPAQLCQIF